MDGLKLVGGLFGVAVASSAIGSLLIVLLFRPPGFVRAFCERHPRACLPLRCCRAGVLWLQAGALGGIAYPLVRGRL